MRQCVQSVAGTGQRSSSEEVGRLAELRDKDVWREVKFHQAKARALGGDLQLRSGRCRRSYEPLGPMHRALDDEPMGQADRTRAAPGSPAGMGEGLFARACRRARPRRSWQPNAVD
jgi:hypothetical protein